MILDLLIGAGAFAVGWGDSFALAACIIALSTVAYFWPARE
jgi:hypothetical protein